MKEYVLMTFTYLPFVLFIAGVMIILIRLIHKKSFFSSTSVNKERIYTFFIISLRWYLGYYMIDYGFAKILGEQFGVSNPEMMEKPLKEVDKFYLAWYLFSLSKAFNCAVGILQILGGIFILINRTALAGALVLLPVIANILLIDVAFTTNMFGSALVVRLFFMLAADIVIILDYKAQIKLFIKLLYERTHQIHFSWRIYLLMPLIGLLLDFILAIIGMPLRWVIQWFLH